MGNSEAFFFFWQSVDKIIKISEDEKNILIQLSESSLNFFLNPEWSIIFPDFNTENQRNFCRKFQAVGILPFEI